MNFSKLISLALLLVGGIMTSTRVQGQEAAEDMLFVVVEEPATPKGGMPAFYQYLQDSLKYPKDALKEGVSGKVFVEFIVGRDGIIEQESIKLLRGIHPSCDQEALRVIRELPEWVPGKQGGKPVRQKMTFPINFKIDEEVTKEPDFSIVEVQARPKDGMGGFYKYIQSNLKYPKEAKRKRIEGKVFVEFVVGKDGHIEEESIKVVKKVHPSLDQEAIRIIREAPQWIPATQNERPVRQKMTFPINFRR